MSPESETQPRAGSKHQLRERRPAPSLSTQSQANRQRFIGVRAPERRSCPSACWVGVGRGAFVTSSGLRPPAPGKFKAQIELSRQIANEFLLEPEGHEFDSRGHFPLNSNLSIKTSPSKLQFATFSFKITMLHQMKRMLTAHIV